MPRSFGKKKANCFAIWEILCIFASKNCAWTQKSNSDGHINFDSRSKQMDNQQEIFPIVDESGAVTGSATRGECHSGTKLLHPVVHLHVFNSKGDIYLQRRPDWKDIQPGKWDTAVGGHVDYGETPEEALQREVGEELGIADFQPEMVDKYVFESQRERELVYVSRTTYDGEIRPSAEELDGGRFWSMKEIGEAMGKGILTPNFESEFKRCFSREWLLIKDCIYGETD